MASLEAEPEAVQGCGLVGRVQQSTAAAEILLQHEQVHTTKNEKQWITDHQTKMKEKKARINIICQSLHVKRTNLK